MQNWKRTLGAASVCLAMLGATPVMAFDLPVIISAPEQVVTSDQTLQTVSGVVTYQDLEGGFYAVAGYRLIGAAEQFEQYLGLQVQVTGTFSDEMSVYMTKAFKVEEIKLQEQQRLSGELTWVELESGFYAVAGYRLIGDAEQFEQYLGQRVTVSGKLSDQASIYMTKAITVDEIINAELAEDQPADRPRMVEATRPLPTSVTVNGTRVSFSQDPLVIDGTLFIPLKAVVKAAGGRVHWSGKDSTATVEMPDRMAYFVLGEQEAEMNENNVRYLMRNMIAMAKAPLISRGHTYISADALSNILGVYEAGETSETMQLVIATGSGEQTPEEQQSSMIGTIQEIQNDGQTRILFTGSAMQNGEPYLIWLTVTEETDLRWGSRWTKRLVHISDLEEGQKIEVELAGPIMESYPAQGSASLVVVLEQDEAEATDLFTGTVKDIESGERTRILVSGPAMQNGEPTMVWVTLADNTEVSRSGNEVPAEISDLQVGQTVQVKLTGPLLASYPAQGGSNSVVIIEG